MRGISTNYISVSHYLSSLSFKILCKGNTFFDKPSRWGTFLFLANHLSCSSSAKSARALVNDAGLKINIYLSHDLSQVMLTFAHEITRIMNGGRGATQKKDIRDSKDPKDLKDPKDPNDL